MTSKRSRGVGWRAIRKLVRPRARQTSDASENGDPRDDLNELAQDISTAIAKTRQLNLPTSAYILSMVMVEVSEALKAAADDEEQEEGDAAG